MPRRLYTRGLIPPGGPFLLRLHGAGGHPPARLPSLAGRERSRAQAGGLRLGSLSSPAPPDPLPIFLGETAPRPPSLRCQRRARLPPASHGLSVGPAVCISHAPRAAQPTLPRGPTAALKSRGAKLPGKACSACLSQTSRHWISGSFLPRDSNSPKLKINLSHLTCFHSPEGRSLAKHVAQQHLYVVTRKGRTDPSSDNP